MTRLQCGALKNAVRGVAGTNVESTVCYLVGVEIDNALDIAEKIEV